MLGKSKEKKKTKNPCLDGEFASDKGPMRWGTKTDAKKLTLKDHRKRMRKDLKAARRSNREFILAI